MPMPMQLNNRTSNPDNCDISEHIAQQNKTPQLDIQYKDMIIRPDLLSGARTSGCWGNLVFENRLERLVQSVYPNQRQESVVIMFSMKFSKLANRIQSHKAEIKADNDTL